MFAVAGEVGLAEIVGRLPAHRLGCRPQLPDMDPAYDTGAQHPHAAFRTPLIDRIAPQLGHRHVDDVPDPEILQLDVCGERAVQHRQLQVRFAAEHGELLATGQGVDDVAVADDVQVVQRHGVGVGTPHHRDVPGLVQRLRREHLDGGLGVELVPVGAIARLGVLEQDLRGGLGAGGGVGHGGRCDPCRWRCVLQLIGGMSRAREQEAGRTEQ